MSWSERRKSELPLLHDSGRDLFRNLLPIGSCQGQLSFRRIGKKPAFNENRRQPALAKHVIFGRADPTVRGADAINNLLLNARGEHCTAIVFGVGLNTVRATSRRGIIVDADEDCVAFRVGDRASQRQWNKNIRGARYYRTQARSLQKLLQTQCRIECDRFFGTIWPGIPPGSEPPCPGSMTTVENEFSARTCPAVTAKAKATAVTRVCRKRMNIPCTLVKFFIGLNLVA